MADPRALFGIRNFSHDEEDDFGVIAEDELLWEFSHPSMLPDVQAQPWTEASRPTVFARFAAADLVNGVRLLASGELAQIAGQPARIVRLVVEPWVRHEDVEVTGALLRGIHLAEIRNRALRQLREYPEMHAFMRRVMPRIPPLTVADERAAEVAATTLAERARRGRPSRGDDFYQYVALTYLALQAEGFGRGILLEFAGREGERQGKTIPRETVRDWVRGARERGFLSPGVSGKAGAAPGPRLKQKEE